MDDLAQWLSQAETTVAEAHEQLSAASQQLHAAQTEAASAAARLRETEVCTSRWLHSLWMTPRRLLITSGHGQSGPTVVFVPEGECEPWRKERPSCMFECSSGHTLCSRHSLGCSWMVLHVVDCQF